MYKLGFTLIAAWLLVCTATYGEIRQPIKFQQISVSQGLSQSTVFDIAQDRNSYLWIGTSDGLNRFDGYEFSLYSHDQDDPSSISSNKISTIFTDSRGTLWIGSSQGISRYNNGTDSFSNYAYRDRVTQVFDIEQAGPDLLLVTSPIGIFLFDTKNETFYLKSGSNNIRYKNMCKYGQDILIGSSAGVHLYNVSTGNISRILPELSGYDISEMAYVAGKECWIGTFGNGLFRTDGNLTITSHYTRTLTGKNGLGSDYIRMLKMDFDNRLWIGTIEGLFVYYPEEELFESYTYNSDDNNSLGHNSVRSIFIDNQQGIWVGTFYGGLNYYHPVLFRFGNIKRHTTHNSLNDNTVNCITEDRKNKSLWIGTNDGGLNHYDIFSGRFTSFKAEYPYHTLKSNNIKCILPDSLGNLYIGTHAGGLTYLNTRSNQREHYTLNPSVPAFNSCYSIIDSGDGKLWLGTLNGLLLLDKKTKKLSRNPVVQQMPRINTLDIYAMLKDSKERIWMCTNNGAFLYDSRENKIRSFENMVTDKGKTISNALMMTITEDSRGNVWIGSDQGLLKFVDESQTFEYYSTADGLPNSRINAIVEDGLGRLWISTNKGMSNFDPFERTFRNYKMSDGIGNEQFVPHSFCMSSSGNIYFGGTDGLTYFNPTDLPNNPYSPAPIIKGISVFNREVTRDDEVKLSRDDLGNNTSVTFPSRYNVFSVKYMVINPISLGNNLFSYTLKGFDNQWYETKNREIGYSNLPPGKYVFMLRACNNDGVWSNTTTAFEIHITPMWYQTMLARIVYVFIALGIIFLAIRFYFERMDRRRVEEMSQEKVRFYINLSHELRTPLTLIVSPLEEIRQHGVESKYVDSRINMIRRNTSRLLHMVNQMLDYRKTETGMLRIQVSMNNLEDIALEVFSMFEINAQNRDIDYTFESGLKSQSHPVDRMFIERILINLLSNAFKFTPDSGNIKLSLNEQADRLVIKVQDNGRGISEEDKLRIFERFYKVDESRPGTGIGLAIVKRLVELHRGTIDLTSLPEKGTEFTILLPAKLQTYSRQELKSEDSILSQIPGTDPTLYLEESEAQLSDVDIEQEDNDKQETLLIVEDNAEIKKYLKDSFRDRFRVLTASNGQEALALIRKSAPDVIITDVMMPVMDGLKLVHSIKQNIQMSHIPVIVITAKDSMEDQVAGMEAGVDDYIVKPFHVSLLSAKINNLLKAKYRLMNHYSTTAEIEPEKIAQNGMDGEFLKKAIRIVEDNMSNVNFSADDFCSALHISRSSLHIKMKAITGQSTINFIRKMRFEYACKLIQDGRYTIAEISEMAGFNSPSYFTTTFKKCVGCLPTEYGKIKKSEPDTTG